MSDSAPSSKRWEVPCSRSRVSKPCMLIWDISKPDPFEHLGSCLLFRLLSCNTWGIIVILGHFFSLSRQAAVLISDKNAAEDPFFMTVPNSLQWFMLVLATLATIIASQAMISGCFGLIAQAIELEIFPRVAVIHTSDKQRGQVYIPSLNYFLMIGSIALVLLFQHSASLAAIYGISVAGDMLLTSILFSLVIYYKWRLPWPVNVLYIIAFWTLDSLIFSSALLKVPSGGYISIIITMALFLLMASWCVGVKTLQRHVYKSNVFLGPSDYHHLAQQVRKSDRGIGVFMRDPLATNTLPFCLPWYAKVSGVLPKHVIVMTLEKTQHHRAGERIRKEYRDDILHVTLRYGYGEKPKHVVPQALMTLRDQMNRSGITPISKQAEKDVEEAGTAEEGEDSQLPIFSETLLSNEPIFVFMDKLVPVPDSKASLITKLQIWTLRKLLSFCMSPLDAFALAECECTEVRSSRFEFLTTNLVGRKSHPRRINSILIMSYV